MYMDFAEMRSKAKQDTETTMARLLKTFEFVPDDKLEWSPSATARTALWIVGHCGAANRAFATILRGEELPIPADPKEAAARIRESGRDIKTREAAVQSVRDSTSLVLEALDKVTPEMAASSPNSPFGPVPFTFWMRLPADHMTGHAHQLDYLETIWGDLENHQ